MRILQRNSDVQSLEVTEARCCFWAKLVQDQWYRFSRKLFLKLYLEVLVQYYFLNKISSQTVRGNPSASWVETGKILRVNPSPMVLGKDGKKVLITLAPFYLLVFFKHVWTTLHYNFYIKQHEDLFCCSYFITKFKESLSRVANERPTIHK